MGNSTTNVGFRTSLWLSIVFLLINVPEYTHSFANIAMNKPALQSSTYIHPDQGECNRISGSAWKAVDGILNPEYCAGSCSHTEVEDTSPWWQVDLGSKYSITHVSILNRALLAERLAGFEIEVSMTNDTDTNGELRDAVLCFKDTGLQLIAGDLINVTCAEQIEGRFLRILKRRLPILTLCELLVTGVPVGDQTTNEDTTSTSTTEAAPSDHFNTTCHSCQCHNTNASLKYMNKSIENLILELQEKLLVHKKATSSFKRKLLSARDGRLSSQVIGSAGLLILVLVCMVIVLPDLVTFIRFVRLRLRKTE